MKQSLLILLAASLLLLGCHQDLPPVEPEPPTPDGVALSFDRIDLFGADYLAVTAAKADGYMLSDNRLLKVDKNGNTITPTCYFYSRISQETRTDLRVAPTSICSYANSSYILMTECAIFDSQENEVGYGVSDSKPSFLVCVKDGRVFDVSDMGDILPNRLTRDAQSAIDANGNLVIANGRGQINKVNVDGSKIAAQQLTPSSSIASSFLLIGNKGVFVASDWVEYSSRFSNGLLGGEFISIFYPNGGVDEIRLSGYRTEDKRYDCMFHIGDQVKLFERRFGGFSVVGSEDDAIFYDTISVKNMNIASYPPHSLSTAAVLTFESKNSFYSLDAAIECRDYYVLESIGNMLIVYSRADNSVIKRIENYGDFGLFSSGLMGTMRYHIDFDRRILRKYDFETFTYDEIPLNLDQSNKYGKTSGIEASVDDMLYITYMRRADNRSSILEISIETGEIKVIDAPGSRSIVQCIKIN